MGCCPWFCWLAVEPIFSKNLIQKGLGLRRPKMRVLFRISIRSGLRRGRPVWGRLGPLSKDLVQKGNISKDLIQKGIFSKDLIQKGFGLRRPKMRVLFRTSIRSGLRRARRLRGRLGPLSHSLYLSLRRLISKRTCCRRLV